MKVTGIVRRIDDLDRIVIQKKIRSNLCIQERAPLAYIIDTFQQVCFVIHSVVESWKEAVLLQSEVSLFLCKKEGSFDISFNSSTHRPPQQK